jgi:hypothetical protein
LRLWHLPAVLPQVLHQRCGSLLQHCRVVPHTLLRQLQARNTHALDAQVLVEVDAGLQDKYAGGEVVTS